MWAGESRRVKAGSSGKGWGRLKVLGSEEVGSDGRSEEGGQGRRKPWKPNRIDRVTESQSPRSDTVPGNPSLGARSSNRRGHQNAEVPRVRRPAGAACITASRHPALDTRSRRWSCAAVSGRCQASLVYVAARASACGRPRRRGAGCPSLLDRRDRGNRGSCGGCADRDNTPGFGVFETGTMSAATSVHWATGAWLVHVAEVAVALSVGSGQPRSKCLRPHGLHLLADLAGSR